MVVVALVLAWCYEGVMKGVRFGVAGELVALGVGGCWERGGCCGTRGDVGGLVVVYVFLWRYGVGGCRRCGFCVALCCSGVGALKEGWLLWAGRVGCCGRRGVVVVARWRMGGCWFFGGGWVLVRWGMQMGWR